MSLSIARSLTSACCAILVAGGVVPQLALAQDRVFSITGSAGYGFLNLGAVDAKNASDAAGWGSLGIPVSEFLSVKRSPFWSGRISYRSTRDFSVSISGSNFSKTVFSSYEGTNALLQLERSVGATDLSLGIAYFPTAQPYFFEWYLQVNVGLILARATAITVGSEATKPAGFIIMVPFIDTQAKYDKSKLSVAFFAGADVPLFQPVFLKAEAGYRLAQVGELDGDISRFGVHTSATSTTLFDFSGFMVSVGAGIAF